MKINKFLSASPLFYSNLLYERIANPFQVKLKKSGLTFRQSLILISIYFEKELITPSDLATSLYTTPSNISHALNYLESKRWIQRVQHPENRKKYLIKLTLAGQKKALRVIPMYNSLQSDLEAHFGESTILAWNKKAQNLIEFSTKLLKDL